MLTLDQLPDQCLIAIFLHLSIDDLLAIAPVCRRWNLLQVAVREQVCSLSVRGTAKCFVNYATKCAALHFVGIHHFDLESTKLNSKSTESMFGRGISFVFPSLTEAKKHDFICKKFPNVTKFSYYGNSSAEVFQQLFNTWDVTHLRLIVNKDFLWSDTFWKNIWLSKLQHLSVIIACNEYSVSNGSSKERLRKLFQQLQDFNIGITKDGNTELLFDLVAMLSEKECRKVGLGLFFGREEHDKYVECKTTLKIFHKTKPWISSKVTRFSHHVFPTDNDDFLVFALESYRLLDYLNISFDCTFKFSELFGKLSQLEHLKTLILNSVIVSNEVLATEEYIKTIQNQFDFVPSKKHVKLPKFKQLKSLTLTNFIIETNKIELFEEMFPNIQQVVIDYPAIYCVHMVQVKKCCIICPSKAYSLLAHIESVRRLTIKINHQIVYEVCKKKQEIINFYAFNLNDLKLV